MKKTNKHVTAGLLSVAGSLSLSTAFATETPNVIIIYMDDMGYADVGCYGQEKWKTPCIDQLAKEGIRFTDAYSASPISSPSRAALLTGRYPARMGVNDVFYPQSYTGIPQEEYLISELLQSAGYYTGIVGKWHLGSRD
ncbi:MAG: sulfatase-like hydrolase/transferase, partial [Candidatus Symbiothrix sp.]|nr:sulfatase-like hydrolase/transferase [Candidatus Symbiothrix sp.]